MKTRILLIDDELRILETFARNLKLAGYTVLTAEGGKKGLGLYYQEQPDIVLLDLKMPELSGLEVLQAMREHDPEVNVILVTGHADQDDVITALRAGASDLLSKPVSQPALESALRRAEERMQLKQKLRASQDALRQQNEQLEAIVQARTEELRKSEERYRSLFTNNHAVMLLIDPDTGDIVDANPAACAYYGYSKDELTARTIVEINALSEDEVFHEIAQAQSESRQHFLFRHRLANGEVRDVEVYSGPIWVHEKQLLYSIIHDITERKQAKDALRASEERYRLLAETTPDIIVLHDLEGHIIYLNQAGLDFAGLELPEAIGQSITTFISPNRLADLEARRAQRLADDETFYRYTTEFVNRVGQRMLAEVHSTPIVRDGHVSEILLVARDITERVHTEEALLESQERLRRLLESTNDLIVLQDLEGRYLYYNGPSHYGLESEDVLGTTPHDWFPKDIADLMMDRIHRVVANGESITAEQAVEWQGELMWFSDEIFPVRDRAGDITAVGIISHDITERKQTEEELALRRQLWDALMASTPDLIYFKDAHHGLIRASQAYADAVGVDVEELAGKTAADLWPHEAEDILADERRVLAGEPIVDKERIATTASGETRWYLLTKSPIYQDGKVIGFFAVDRDITDWKRAEEARERLTAQVQDQARQLEQILVTVPEGVLLLDAAGHIMLVNPVAKEALAFLMGQDAATLDQPVTHLGDRPLTELLTSPPTTGLWHEIEWQGRVFEVIARPMEPARSNPRHVEGSLSNGNGNGSEDWVLLLRDVTQEREIQQLVQQQERLAAVGQLAAGIAHDFNNIIAVILLYTQMALNAKGLPLATRKGLETVVQQAQQAAALVEQILDFSRRAVLERRPMDLTPFLKEVVKLLERTVPENIKIKLSYGLDEYTVSADPTRMQQVILNLIVNARDAMPEGGELRIDLSMLEATDPLRCGSCGELLEGEWVCIAVTDTGHGISPDALPHIFEPFFTTKEIGQGAGLGLAQVFGLVKRHDGHIDVTTRLGEGTTFTIYLPALLAHQPVAPLSDSQALVKGQGETILIVEDNAVLREALVESLALLDYCILEAGNGRQALDVLDQHAEEVALVLSDLVMPVMGGQALFHALRDRDLALPVVMLSGHPMEEELEDLKAQGLTGWMLKPPDIEHLSQLLAQTLEEAHEGEKD